MDDIVGEIRRIRSRLTPWATVALILGVLLFGYYILLGMRYFNASNQIESSNSEISDLRVGLRRVPPKEEELKAEVESFKQELEVTYGLFKLLESDDLVTILTTTAQETSVNLQKVVSADTAPKILGEIQYSTQPMVLTLQGKTVDIYGFLSLLQRKIPVVQVIDITLTGLEALPTAQVQLLFYFAPKIKSEA